MAFYPGFELGLYVCHPGFAYIQQGRLRICGPFLDCEHFSRAGNWTELVMPPETAALH